MFKQHHTQGCAVALNIGMAVIQPAATDLTAVLIFSTATCPLVCA